MTISADQDALTLALNNVKSQLKLAKKSKAGIAVQFKNAVAGSELHAQLITQMQESSTEIKAIEQHLKDIEKKLAQSTEAELPVRAKELPPLFTIDPASLWSEEFSIHELNSTEFARWYEFVASLENATSYHQPAWNEVIAASFKNPTRIWVAQNSAGAIIGGIPLTFFSSALFGKFAVSIPYVNYGGVLTPYFNVAQQLLAYLPKLCRAESLSHIEVRTTQENLATNSSSKKASMILRLPETSDILEKDLGSKLRAQVKKCEEYNPSIRFGKLELLEDFYRVFAKNMRDLGTPVYAKTWFANILKDSRIHSTLVVAYVNNNPVSTGFLIGFNGMLEIPWASTVKEANLFNTNMWMYRKILDFAIEQKFTFFDFGRSTQNAGTYKFKKQWGSVPYVHHWYKVLPNEAEAAPELNPDNPKFALMIFVWKRLPIWLTKIIGPLIIRHVP